VRVRLHARDGRRVLWLPAGVARAELQSAPLYRARGELERREHARVAGVLVLVVAGVGRALLLGARAIGPILRSFAGAAAGIAPLLLFAPAAADDCVPLTALMATAPALGPPLALAAAAPFDPLHLLPAGSMLLAAGVSHRLSRSRTRPSPALPA
jgi:hypothetical protein